MKHIHKSLKTTVILSAIFSLLILFSACSNTTKGEDPGQATTDKSGETNIPAVTNNEPEPASKPITSAPMAKAESASLARIVFITTSKACGCTLTRCQNGEAALQKVLASYPNAPQMERVDFAEERDKARSLTQKHAVFMLPVALLIDGKDSLLDKLEGEFTEAEAKKMLELYQ